MAKPGWRSIDLYPDWPLTVSGFNQRGGIPCNLDGDAELEIVYTINNQVYAWNLDATLVPGWPRTVNNFLYRPAAFGDIDGDGEEEVVVSTRFPGTGNSGWLHCYEKDGSDVAGFPIPLTTGGASGTPALADIDDDGALEIVVAERNWPDGAICVYHGDGTVAAGWPQAMDHVPGSATAVGDITDDGVPEIVGESYVSIYAFDALGNLLPGFPHTPGADRAFSYSTPVLADLDSDGLREIICGDHGLDTGTGRVHVLRSDGSVFPGWPQSTGHWIYAPPAVGDVDGDGAPDIVIGDKQLSMNPTNFIYAWNAAGEDLPGFPLGPVWAVNTQALIVDLDGDAGVELIFDDNSMQNGMGAYHAYNHDGTLVAGWPLPVQGTTHFINPFVADLNQDGELDIVGAGSNQDLTYVYVHVWDANVSINAELSILPVLQYNLRHDGVYEPPDLTGIPMDPVQHERGFLTCSPNPFSSGSTITLSTSLPGGVSGFGIFDIGGRLVRRVASGNRPEEGISMATWDGRDSAGQPLAAGVYLVTTQQEDERSIAGKIVLLR